LSSWLARRWRPIENRIRRLLHLRIRGLHHTVALAGGIEFAGSVRAIQSIDPEEPLEEQVAFLLRRDREHQERIADLSTRISDVETKAARELTEMHTRSRAELLIAIEREAAAYRPVRIFGAVALAIGLALSTAGNFATS
jgi:hypothetical protein